MLIRLFTMAALLVAPLAAMAEPPTPDKAKSKAELGHNPMAEPVQGGLGLPSLPGTVRMVEGAQNEPVLPHEAGSHSPSEYIIEPPDTLLIESMKLVPRPPCRIEPLAVVKIGGEHLVAPDGTVTLGTYGSLNVTGLTVRQAKEAIERYLSRWFLTPDVSIKVNGFNSKIYYVIFDGEGYDQKVVALPITGQDTVLDAIARVDGLPQSICHRSRVWVTRSSPGNSVQILPVDWKAMTREGDSKTNWQLFPGDRVFVAADPFMAVEGILAKVPSPLKRLGDEARAVLERIGEVEKGKDPAFARPGGVAYCIGKMCGSGCIQGHEITEAAASPCCADNAKASRLETAAVKLVKAYDEACAAGNREDAKRLAKAALTLDPMCLRRK